MCLLERKRLHVIHSLTLGCCSLLPASRVGGYQAGRALLVLGRLDYGGHNHLLPSCGRVSRVTEILVLESWGWENLEPHCFIMLSNLFPIMLVVNYR